MARTQIAARMLHDGGIVQVVHWNYQGRQTLSTTFPRDGTVPQITEGGQVASVTITPKSTTNLLWVLTNFNLNLNTTGEYACIGLFRSDSTNAIATKDIILSYYASAPVVLDHMVTAGTTSALTFSTRIGASGGNMNYNGDGAYGGQPYGSTEVSNITVVEIQA